MASGLRSEQLRWRRPGEEERAIAEQKQSTRAAPDGDGAVYGASVATVEPYSIEHIPSEERHGRTGSLFWLWFAANLTIADYALGFLPITLGVPLGTTIAMLLIGNVLGAALVGACAAMGIRGGYPQMYMGRRSFGRTGGYLPAGLNWISTAGWFTVNTILGAFALRILWSALPFWTAAGILVAAQTAIVIYGHNLIHAFERVMAAVLGVLFAIATIVALTHWDRVTGYQGSAAGRTISSAAIVLAVSFAYVMSWSPYASDYSRYLPEGGSLKRAFVYTFAGAGLASLWLEILGALVAIVVAGRLTAIPALDDVMGAFGSWALIAIVLGACAANALNLYSNTMSARVLDLRLRRWQLAVAGGGLGFVLALIGQANFLDNYQNFLLLLDYWITPWLAIVLVDFYVLRHQRPEEFRLARPFGSRGLICYLIGVVVSIPFMSGSYFTGFLAPHLGGADFSYFIGFAVAGLTYVLSERADTVQV
ncbi:MAG: purine-cytosine permease family protein [Actinomycetota bacterium]